MENIESEGKTVVEAVENALKKAGLRRDQVEVLILQEASAGLFGMGVKLAKVRIHEKRWAADGSAAAPAPAPAPAARAKASSSPGAENRIVPKVQEVSPRLSRRESSYPPAAASGAPSREQERSPASSQRRPRRAAPAKSRPERSAPPSGRAPSSPPVFASRPPRELPPPRSESEAEAICAKASLFLTETLPLMNFTDAVVKSQWDADQQRVKTSVETSEAERLIGREGKTLESLQFILTLMLTRHFNSPVAVWVDTQGFWDKKEKEILDSARKAAEIVKSTGKPYRLAPMEAPLRRMIHRSFEGHPDVVTASEGEGSWRKIILKPKK